MPSRLKAHTKALIATTSLAALLVIQGCNGSSTTPEQHLKNAQKSFDAQDFKTSEIELKNALQQNSSYSEARLLLGKIFLTTGNSRTASIEFKKALESSNNKDAILPLLGESLLLQGSSEEVITKFQPADTDTPALQAEKNIFLGEAYLQLGDISTANKHFSNTLSLNPDSSRARQGLARIAMASKDFDKASTLISEAIDKNSDNIRAWITKADIDSIQKKTNESIDSLLQAKKHITNKKNYLQFIVSRNLAFTYITSGDMDKAKDEMSALNKGYYKNMIAKDVKLIYTQAFIALHDKNYTAAKAFGEQIIGYSDNFPGILLLLGTVNAEEKNFEQAERQLNEFSNKFPNHIQSRRLLGLVQVLKNDPDRALDTLKSVLANENPDLPSLALMANAALINGNPEESSRYYAKALEQKPDESALLIGLARSLIAQNNYDGAIAELNKIPKTSKQYSAAQLAIVQANLKAENFQNAFKIIDALPKEQQETAQLKSLSGTIHLIDGNFPEAERLFNESIEAKPGYAPALRQLAIIAIRKGEAQKANNLFETALKSNPNNSELMIEYAEHLINTQKLDRAESLLIKAKDITKDNERAGITLAKLLLKKGKPSLAISELSNFKDNKNPLVFIALGNARMMLREYDRALEEYNTSISLVDNSSLPHYLKYTALQALNKNAEAKNALHVSIERNAQFLPALLALVEISIQERDLVKANEYLNTADSIAANNIYNKILRADISSLEGDFNTSLKLYLDVFSQNSNDTIAKKILHTYWKLGDDNGAIQFITTALESQPNNANLLALLGGLHLKNNENQAAISAYKKSVDIENNNPVILNNLAWLLKDTDLQQAQAYAEKALLLAPNSPEIKDTLETIKQLK